MQFPIKPNHLIYSHFKNIIKLIHDRKTTFPEQHQRKASEPLQCPSCGQVCYIKGWLTQHRENNAHCVAEYYQELERMKIRTTPDCGLIFESRQDRGNMKNITAVTPKNAYNNNCEPGKSIDELRTGSVYPRLI